MNIKQLVDNNGVCIHLNKIKTSIKLTIFKDTLIYYDYEECEKLECKDYVEQLESVIEKLEEIEEELNNTLHIATNCNYYGEDNFRDCNKLNCPLLLQENEK